MARRPLVNDLKLIRRRFDVTSYLEFARRGNIRIKPRGNPLNGTAIAANHPLRNVAVKQKGGVIENQG